MTADLRKHFSCGNRQSQQRQLCLALELGEAKWKLALSASTAAPPRRVEVAARDIPALLREIAQAKRRLGLAAETPVLSCYEAGRDGFWLHRCLTEHGVQNLVVDSASIEVNRRQRRAKSDGLDAGKLLSMLWRYAGGEERVWSVVQVPTPEEEDARHLHRELQTLKQETTEHVNRIKGLLASLGLVLEVDRRFPQHLEQLRQWNGQPVPEGLRQRLMREFERLQGANRQIRELCRRRRQEVAHQTTPAVEQVKKLLGLRAIGINGAWLYVHEFFCWRKFKNGKQVGSLAGLTPTPYGSGQIDYEQGISKAGNRRMRWMAVELAWSWLHFQPQSALARWYMTRFGQGSKRQRRIGIVALARKLLVQVWRYLETGVPPAGAELSDWRTKLAGTICSLDVA